MGINTYFLCWALAVKVYLDSINKADLSFILSVAYVGGVKIFQSSSLTRVFVFAAAQPVQTTSVCRFFPDCKKMDCPFYHPKVKHSEV